MQQYDIKECKAVMQQLVMVSGAAGSWQAQDEAASICPARLRVCCGLKQQYDDADPPQNDTAVAWRHASGLRTCRPCRCCRL